MCSYSYIRLTVMTLSLILQQRSLCWVRGFSFLSRRLSTRSDESNSWRKHSLPVADMRNCYHAKTSAEKLFEMRNSGVFIPSRQYRRHVLKCSDNDNDEMNVHKIIDRTSEKEMHSDRSDLQRLLGEKSQISPYWINQLSQIQHGNARNLIKNLTSINPVGFVGAKGPAKDDSYQAFYLEQKKKHPECVILMRTGEFYETMGVDALMLIAYTGLNAMGGKAKAGCPIGNIQATLDGLTNHGLSVAVYEEKAPQGEIIDPKKKIKSRSLSQIVFPGASTYMYDLSLRSDNIEFRENYPVIGVIKTISGYTLCQGYLDEQAMDISERLTLETVRVLVKNSGFVEPIYLQNVENDIFGSNVSVVKLAGYTELQFPSEV